MKVASLAVLFAAGALLAAALAAAQTTTDTTTETTTATTTVEQTTTSVQTETVEHTRTRTIPLPAQTTTVSETSVSNTPAWVWVILALLAAGVIALLILYFTRRGQKAMSPEERRRRLEASIGSWVAQGWAVESRTGDSAILRRGAELMQLSVDEAGGITGRPLNT
jgi:hypothetical protein